MTRVLHSRLLRCSQALSHLQRSPEPSEPPEPPVLGADGEAALSVTHCARTSNGLSRPASGSSSSSSCPWPLLDILTWAQLNYANIILTILQILLLSLATPHCHQLLRYISIFLTTFPSSLALGHGQPNYANIYLIVLETLLPSSAIQSQLLSVTHV